MESYAIISVSGKQCKVTPEALVRVPRIEAEVGSKLDIDQVLLCSDGKTVQVGRPVVAGKKVKAEVVRHGRESKIVVFKKKRRKDYRRTRGHRQDFTELRIVALPK
jgi:large subunit ribosomal protein L21